MISRFYEHPGSMFMSALITNDTYHMLNLVIVYHQNRRQIVKLKSPNILPSTNDGLVVLL